MGDIVPLGGMSVQRDKIAIFVILVIVLLGWSALGCAREDPGIQFEGERYFGVPSDDDAIQRFEASQSERELSIRELSEDEWDYAVETDGDTYHVAGSASRVRVGFPDGRVLTRTHSESASSGSVEDGATASWEDWDRVDALGTLVFGAPTERAPEGPRRGPILGAVLLVAGLLSALKPEWAFKLETGWRIKDAEPSDAYLIVSRVLGSILALLGLALLVR